MTTRDEAIQRAGKTVAEAYRRVQEGTAREAAERAYTPGGPGLDELEARIIRFRNSLTEQADAA